MAFIISCSGRKICPLQNPNSQPSTIEALSFNEELLIWRNQNIENHNVILDWNYCLPAWQLYSGRLYSQVEENNWIKSNTKVLIVSALFGLIKHTDLIPTYDLFMTDGNNGIASYWRENVDLNEFINEQYDVDLLFKKYRKAFNINGERVSQFNIQNFIGRGHNQGKWLNQQLNIL
jgi:cytoplasmic iron level regulating protein YaaA (DUF328/UPF0246 family)